MPGLRPESVIAKKRPALARSKDPNSLVASAALLTGPTPSKSKITTADWQERAWKFYDTIGELRMAVGWLGSNLSRVNLVAASPPADQGAEPTAIDLNDETANVTRVQRRAAELVAQIAGGIAGQGQLLGRCAGLLTVPGVSYIYVKADPLTDEFGEWRALSSEEVKPQNQDIQVLDAVSGDWVTVGPSDLLIKCWRSHLRRSSEADSPVRGVLDSLEEVAAISARIKATSDSRLAGNGVWMVPTETEFIPPPGYTLPDGSEGSGEDHFVETMQSVMEMGYADRTSAAARVPMVAKMPADLIGKSVWQTFWSDLDAQADPLRQAAIKRFATGMDMPAEVVTGLADPNHWNVWKIDEVGITLHVEPLAETIVHAFTIGFLVPALQAEQFSKDEIATVMVWYDTTDLTTRPDRTKQAEVAHGEVVISNDAYLREIGLSEEDKPDDAEFRVRTLIKMASGAPTLAPAMLALAGVITWDEAAQAQALAAPAPTPGEEDEPAVSEPGAQDPPEEPEATDTPDETAVTAAGLLGASDGLVVRALERAGSRLRAAAGRGRPGGTEAIPCPDPTTLHCAMSATEYASLDALLAGAWDRVPTVAARWGMDAESLTACLDGYARGLLASGHAHDYDRLASALGMDRGRFPVPV